LISTEAGQALYVDYVYNALWAARATANVSKLALIDWYWWADKVASGAAWGEACGLRRSDGTAKPSLTNYTVQPQSQGL
jgi:hypothetical protein